MKIEKIKSEIKPIRLQLLSASDDDINSYLDICIFGYRVLICLGVLLAAGKLWVDLTRNPNANSIGYYTPVQRVYGFQQERDYLQVFHGTEDYRVDGSGSSVIYLPWKQWRLTKKTLYGCNKAPHTIQLASDLNCPSIEKYASNMFNVCTAICPKVSFTFSDEENRTFIAEAFIVEEQWKRGKNWFAWASLFSRSNTKRWLHIWFPKEFQQNCVNFAIRTAFEITDQADHKSAFKRYCKKYHLTFIEQLPDEPRF